MTGETGSGPYLLPVPWRSSVSDAVTVSVAAFKTLCETVFVRSRSIPEARNALDAVRIDQSRNIHGNIRM